MENKDTEVKQVSVSVSDTKSKSKIANTSERIFETNFHLIQICFLTNAQDEIG